MPWARAFSVSTGLLAVVVFGSMSAPAAQLTFTPIAKIVESPGDFGDKQVFISGTVDKVEKDDLKGESFFIVVRDSSDATLRCRVTKDHILILVKGYNSYYNKVTATSKMGGAELSAYHDEGKSHKTRVDPKPRKVPLFAKAEEIKLAGFVKSKGNKTALENAQIIFYRSSDTSSIWWDKQYTFEQQ